MTGTLWQVLYDGYFMAGVFMMSIIMISAFITSAIRHNVVVLRVVVPSRYFKLNKGNVRVKNGELNYRAFSVMTSLLLFPSWSSVSFLLPEIWEREIIFRCICFSTVDFKLIFFKVWNKHERFWFFAIPIPFIRTGQDFLNLIPI